MTRHTKIFITLLLSMIVTATLTNCASQPLGNRNGSVTIAVVESNPGEKGNPDSQSAYAGALLVANQLAEQSGIQINIEPYDDGNDPKKATQIAGQIAKSDAVAVIGQSSIETLYAAGEVYDNAGIPVINIVPTTNQLNEKFPYYFNITFTAESEAAYLANYLRRIDGVQTASIIYTNDEYGEALAKQFGNTFTGLGGSITFRKEIKTDLQLDTQLEEIVSTIIAANPETENPGTLFIATDDDIASQLIILMKRKGVSYPIMGGSNLSTPAFLESISTEPEELTLPGYFTDGILTTRAIFFDSANRYANQFLSDYQTAYQVEGQELPDPGDRVVNGYEAALALAAGIRDTDMNGSDISANRQALTQAMLTMDGPDSGVQGMIGAIFFDPSRNSLRAARFGMYQNGEIVSANTQFEPIAAPNEIKNIQEQIARGRILTVDGGYVYKANVVYAGVDILGIDEIDIKTSTYKVDFYLWFRYRPNEQDTEFKPEDFVFTNAESTDEPVLIRDEVNADGTMLKTYRVTGVFKNQFQFHDYPFDHQKLIVEFRNQNATTSFIQYVVDRIGMRYKSETDLIDNFRSNGAFDSVFGWQVRGAHVDQDTFPTFSTLGNPQNFDRKVSTNYSLINTEIDLQRNSLQYIFKSLLPLLITLILSYITFFLPLGHSERLAVGSTALLTTAFFHLSLADALPEIGYTVAMEYLFYASYGMSALIVLLETISIRIEKAGEEAKKKADKAKYQKRREDLNMVGRIIYPSILFIVMIAGILVYSGVLSLGPKEEAESQHLVNLLLSSGQSHTVKEDMGPSVVPASDTVKLTLSTWRPEDTKQIQILFNDFQAYAKEQGKNIVMEYRPVMSVNYNSIIDIQLSRGAGPDLFYVRPFSVDGTISKYLTPLNNLPIDENFDSTKSIPWTSRNGTYYAVPFVGVVQGVYYNKDYFDRNNLSVPETWEEFLQTAKTIQELDLDVVPISNALNRNEDSEMFMSIAANFLGGPEGRERLMKTDGTAMCYNSRRVVDAFEAIEQLRPYLPKDAATMTSQTSKEMFFQQESVMLFGGSWDLQKVTEKAGFEWGVFAVPAPSYRGKTYVIFQPDIGIGINRATTHPEEARMFLEWLMTGNAVQLTAENLPGFYPLNKIEASRGSNPNDTKFLNLVNTFGADIRWMYTEINNKQPGAADIVRNNLYQMMVNSLSPEDAAQKLQDGLGEWYEPAQTCRK